MFSFSVKCVLGIVITTLIWISQNVAQANVVETIPEVKDSGSKAYSWLMQQRNVKGGTHKWSGHAPRVAIVSQLYNDKFLTSSSLRTRDRKTEITYEVIIQLLADLVRNQKKELSASELAIDVNALIASCLNPRNFHGEDIVSLLRQLYTNSTNPFVALTLCNAKDKMTQADVDKLIDVREDPHRPVWTGTKALKLMALTCMKNLGQIDINVDSKILKELASDLKDSLKGSIENLQTTGLAIQALIASGNEKDDTWDLGDVVRRVISNQSSEGSFGSILDTYYILPILLNKSLLNISAAKCNITTEGDNVTTIDDMNDKFESKVYVKYSLWIGNEVDLARTVQLQVMANSTLFDIMQSVAKTDSMYRFKYEKLNGKPYIYEVSNFQDDQESNKFWFLYKMDKTKAKLTALTASPVDIIPKDKEEFVLWYRSKDHEDIPPFVFNSTKFPQFKNLF